MKKTVRILLVIAIVSLFIIRPWRYYHHRVDVIPSKTEISGPLGPFFQIVGRTYTIDDGVINIDFERIKEGLPSPWQEGMKLSYSGGCEPGFTVEFLDKNGNVLGKTRTNFILREEDFKELVALNIGEMSSLRFSIESYHRAKRFRVLSSFEYNE